MPLQPGKPDLVLKNGKVVTVDNDFSIAEAVAVENGKIIHVGSNAEVDALAREGTSILDLHGKTVLPGIIDSHLHFAWWATHRPPVSLDLSYPTVQSIGDITRLVKERVKDSPSGEWIFGVGWNESDLAECQGDKGRHPTRWDLDPVSADSPVCLLDFNNGHQIWANSKALELAGITDETSSPYGGTIVKDSATGKPTGIFTEFIATSLVMRVIPPWTAGQIKEGMLASMEELLRMGITSITEPGIGQGTYKIARGAVANKTLDVYRELYNEGRLTIRVSILLAFAFWLAGNHSLQKLKSYLDSLEVPVGFDNDHLKIAGLKLAADNWPASRTAWMYDDYTGGGNGQLLTAGRDERERYQQLVNMISYASKQRFRLGIHATGDRAIDACVDGFVKTLDEDTWDARHYVIHGNFVTPQCAKRMAAYQIGVVPQSHFKATHSDVMDEIVGEERSAYEWPLRTLVDSGVHLANSSDAPLANPDWRAGVEAAVTRKSRISGKVSGPEQRLTLKEAIRAYTIEGAWIDHAENLKGSIEVGKLADFCVLDQDILTADVQQIHKIANIMTIVDGKVVYNGQPELLHIARSY